MRPKSLSAGGHQRPSEPYVGFTLIELMIVIAIIAIIAAIAIPNLLRARASANEASAISSLRTLVSSQAMFYQNDLDGDGDYDYATSLGELWSSGLIDSVLGQGTKSGYHFDLAATDRFTQWTAGANPRGVGSTGRRVFYVDQSGVICASSTNADASCTPIERGARAPIDAFDADSFDRFLLDDAVDAILALDASLGGSEALALAAQLLADPANVQIILDALDDNTDGMLELPEIVSTDVLVLARSLIPVLVGGDNGGSIGDDSALVTAIATYFAAIVPRLLLDDVGDEESLPLLAPRSMAQDPAAGSLLDALDGPLTRDQQSCVNALNKALAKIVKAVGKTGADCLKLVAKGESTDVTDCVASDPKGKIGKALAKASQTHGKRCFGNDKSGLPRAPYVYARDDAFHRAAEAELRAYQLISVFGRDASEITLAASTDKTAAGCHRAVLKAAGKCMDAQMKQFLACKKNALAPGKTPFDDGARTPPELEACFGDDPDGKTAKACDRGSANSEDRDNIRKELTKKCADKGLSLSTVLPACASDDIDAVHDCIAPDLTCLVCRAVNTGDDLVLDCDLLDNGASDGSCSETCGDGTVSIFEGCDDGNSESFDGCSSDCREELECECFGEPSSCTCTPTCAHSECVDGEGLSEECSECAMSICALDSYCCDSAWDFACVNAAKLNCGGTCGR